MTTSGAPKASKLPLVLSLFGFVTFIFPVGLIGALLGRRDASRARAANLRPRWQSRAAVVFGVLSLVDTVALMAWMRHTQTEKMAQVGSALARVASAREEAALAKDTACALAEAFLIQRAVGAASVTCPGPLEANGTTASLAGATIMDPSPKTYTVCLARKSRWFVTTAIESSRCPPLPDVPDGPTAEDTERAIQKAMAGAGLRAELDAALARLARVRAVVGAPADHHECPDIGTESLPVVDKTVLPGDADAPPPDAAWRFLTSKAAWAALDPTEDARARRNSAMQVAGSEQRYLLVVDAAERRAPQATATGFTGGSFDGRLALVDVSSGQVLCDAPLAFKSSQSVKTGGGVAVGFKLLPKVHVGGKDISQAIDKDIRETYGRAMAKALDQMTSGRVKARP